MSVRPLPPREFVIEDRGTWESSIDIIDDWGLPAVPVSSIELNRTGATIRDPGNHAAFKGRRAVLRRFHVGFGWQGDDGASRHWVPQGLTGEAGRSDADDDDRRWLAVSWHNEDDAVEKGMRVSFVDVTEWRNPVRYRHVLLVEPMRASGGARATFAAIPAHAGGIVWFKNYLYVTDSRGFDRGRPGGLLVFDTGRITEVDESRDDRIGWSEADQAYFAFGYRYALPQVGRYVQVANGRGTPLRWSFIGVDHTGSNSALMMGEYTTSRRATARLVWWALDPRDGRLAVEAGGHSQASLARACGDERFLQGCLSQDALGGKGTVWLSRSSSDDALYVLPLGGGEGRTLRPWADQPEGLAYSPASNNLWCVTERAGARAVFAIKRNS